MDREVGGGIGMGNTCKPMADSFQCMTKFTTNKKNNKIKKKKKRNQSRLRPQYWVSLLAQMVKNLPAKARDLGSVPGLGRSPRGGNGNPPQYSCLENPMDRGAWRATVHGVTKGQTQLSE